MGKTDFTDYEGFVDKFVPKKTTDDCYTPQPIYDAMLEYVGEQVDLSGKNILRPFKPGGDYENEIYNDNDVVIDNPPFSILSQIVRFYHSRGIPFFLFAPALTLFTSCRINGEPITKIVCGTTITYENGAKVNTSFLTNMWGDGAVIADADLYKRLDKFNQPTAHLRSYVFPKYLISAARLQKIVKRGISLTIPKTQLYRVRKLNDGTDVYGGGFLCSEKAAAEKAVAEKAAAEKAAAVNLSDAEMQIIQSLNQA